MAAHPYKTFLKSRGLTFEQGVAELNRLGARTRQGTPLTKEYLSQLMTGYRKPSYGIAVAMERHAAGSVSVSEIMEFQPAAESTAADAA